MVLTPRWGARWRWWAAWMLLAVASAAGLAALEVQRLRSAFDTDARIAHRLLSQRAAQHDAILATLGLLLPSQARAEGGNASPASPVYRLPALYPQVLAVRERAGTTPWPNATLAAAEAQARRTGHAVLAEVDLPSARATLLAATGSAEPLAPIGPAALPGGQGSEGGSATGGPGPALAGISSPASGARALVLDLRAMVPRDEWPVPAGGPVRAELRHAGQSLVLAAGRATAGAVAMLLAAKPLASSSQPFELVLTRAVGWSELPWVRMAAAALAWAAVLAGAAAWRRQAHHRRRAEELLRLGQVGRLNALGELAAGMAHELNQPLTAVLSATQAAQRLLADEPPELDTARQAMAHAAAQAKRASEVLTRLRRCVERPDAAEAIVPLDLAAAARDALDLLAPELLRHGVVARVVVTAGVQVLAEPVAVQQIVHNLALNALQAMATLPAAERRMDLVVEAQAGQGLLRLGDSGPGLASEVLPRLFEPFFSTRRGGLGLGLAMCETLAQRLSGTLTAANRSTGGAVFTLALPLVPA